MNNFKNKTVVITGAGSGIGKALALNFAKRGANLAIADINEVNLNETVDEAKKSGIKVFSKVLDVSKNEQVLKFAEEVKQNLGNADIMINNAGVALGKMSVEETSIENFEWIMSINFWGMVYGTKAFLPQLKKQETTVLVNVSSLFGLIGAKYQSAYCASKFAIRGFNEVLMAELEDTKIQMHSVHPGGIKTNIAKNSKGGDPKYSKSFEKMLVMPPERAAEIIINGIVKNKKRILIGNDAKGGDIIARIAPITLVNYVQRKLFKKLEQKIAAKEQEAK
jgi:short-subunit dehydrogenase